mmetsp:Transcript_10573/g.27128  ORF Transcript_10573/g.27128 Transcript_10573/m.27128 type:complete len:203 (+) Transcript_10573:104-712(+)
MLMIIPNTPGWCVRAVPHRATCIVPNLARDRVSSTFALSARRTRGKAFGSAPRPDRGQQPPRIALPSSMPLPLSRASSCRRQPASSGLVAVLRVAGSVLRSSDEPNLPLLAARRCRSTMSRLVRTDTCRADLRRLSSERASRTALSARVHALRAPSSRSAATSVASCPVSSVPKALLRRPEADLRFLSSIGSLSGAIGLAFW